MDSAAFCIRGESSEPSLGFALITCSDTRDEAQDSAGAALKQRIAEKGWKCLSYELVRDDRAEISAALVRAADIPEVDVVLTC